MPETTQQAKPEKDLVTRLADAGEEALQPSCALAEWAWARHSAVSDASKEKVARVHFFGAVRMNHFLRYGD